MADPVNASIVTHFQTFEDPHIERTKKHQLLDILVIALCTLLTGGEGFQDMELFGQSKQAWLQTFLALPHGIPSHDTFGRVFARLNPQRFRECFLSWTQAVAQFTQDTLISLDGKTVKASFHRATASSPLHMLSAWCSEQGGLVVGQLKTEQKSNEITAIPELLHLLAIKGCIVTIAAMGCQTAIAAHILDQGGDYLLALKNNHKKTYTTMTQYFHPQIEHTLPWRDADNFFDAFDNTPGRRVRRRVWVMTDLESLPALEKWPGLQAVMAVETIRMAHKQAPVTSDYRFSLASLVRSATAFVTMIRQHWDIENKLHWSLDVTFNEDRCRIRQDHAAENMVALRHMALNLLRQEASRRLSLRQKRLLCDLDEHYLLTVIARAT
jgi:predicted transposase YbfD/YdcC